MSSNPLGLRPFQLADVDHLSLQYGRLIANDPGTGKTFEAGELDRLARMADPEIKLGIWKPTLIVVPKNLRYTWARWFMKYRPDEKLFVIDTRPATKSRLAGHVALENSLKSHAHDIYIVHYEGMKRSLGVLKDIDFLHIVLDEAHRISNRKTQTRKAASVLKATWRTALTGTAASKNPSQVWSILNFLDPKTWSSFWAFHMRYVHEVVDHAGNKSVIGPNLHTLPELQQRLKPIMVRHRKSEVLPELPPKQYKQVWVDLSPKQRKLYDEMRLKMLTWVGENEDEPLVATVVIAQLIRLQQIALATPTFVTKSVRRQTKCILEDRDHEGDCIGPGPEDDEKGVWHGKYHDEEVVEIHLEDPSSKLDAAIEIIEDLVAQGEQVVIFSQFTRMVDLLCARLEKRGITFGKYTGSTRDNTRNRIEEDFEAGRISVFAGQFQAGGVGLNLQTASTVIFLDRAWTARDNIQAEDRIHRIGQFAATVLVIDIMARNTVDMGRFQSMAGGWHGIQRMLGDKTFDWADVQVEDPEDEEMLV
jgi:SNF2 family DNA or RNA helicase